jgi:hypothetical protein
MRMNAGRLLLLLTLATVIPVAAATITTSVICQTASPFEQQAGGGVNVPSASCNTSTSTASASVSVSGPLNVTLTTNASTVGNGFSYASADYQADLSLTLLTALTSPDPNFHAYIRFNLNPHITGFTVAHVGSVGDILTSCPGVGVQNCIPIVSSFSLHLSADTTTQNSLKLLNGFGFVDYKGNALNVQYILTDVTAPEPGTISLVVAGLLASAIAGTRRRSAAQRPSGL